MASAERKRASFTLGCVLIAYLNAWFLTRWPEIPQLKSGNEVLQDLDQSSTVHPYVPPFRKGF